MRWLRPSMSPWKSVAFDALVGVLTALSVLMVLITTPFWPHGDCATGVNEPVQYAFGLCRSASAACSYGG